MVKRIGKDIIILAIGGYVLAGAVCISIYGAKDILDAIYELREH